MHRMSPRRLYEQATDEFRLGASRSWQQIAHPFDAYGLWVYRLDDRYIFLSVANTIFLSCLLALWHCLGRNKDTCLASCVFAYIVQISFVWNTKTYHCPIPVIRQSTESPHLSCINLRLSDANCWLQWKDCYQSQFHHGTYVLRIWWNSTTSIENCHWLQNWVNICKAPQINPQVIKWFMCAGVHCIWYANRLRKCEFALHPIDPIIVTL